jgi:molybdenum cofactor cytidylyltransferase
MAEVWVTELEDGEVGEDDAVTLVSRELGCGSLEIRLAAGGRANLIATEPSCVLVDDELLKQINCTASLAIATVPNFSYARAGQRIATVKSTPFAVAKSQLEAVISILTERGPILQARPVRNPNVGVLYTDPVSGDRARLLFEGVMRQRLERLGTSPAFCMAALEDEVPVAKGLQHLLRTKPTEDVIGRAMGRIGCHIERFLAPVEPGNLFLLGYRDDVPVVSAPGCFRSAKPNIVDLVLPPMLARYRVTGWEIGCLGHGGLLA